MILVTGATGKVGGAAVRALSDEGQPVRALVRATSARETLAPQVEVAVGDLDDTGSLDDALRGVETVVLVSPGDPAQETRLVRAARAASVRHVVYLTSKASADSPIERRRWKAQVEQALADSEIPHTLLRSNAFLQNTLALGPVIATTGWFASSAGDGRMGMVDTRDLGAVAATIARHPEPHAGVTYRLSGPEAISYGQVAETLTDLLGREVVFETITEEEDRARMIAQGVPEAVATMNAQAFHLNATGDADWVTGDVQAITGSAPRSFRTFATDHLAAFRP